MATYVLDPDVTLSDAEVSRIVAAYIGVVTEEVYGAIEYAMPWLAAYLVEVTDDG